MLTKKKYQIIYADPPWEYNKWVWKEKTIKDLNDFYPTMDTETICKMAIPAKDDSWLLLWTTVPKLPDGLKVLTAWGFDYRTSGVWDKGNGLGFFFRIYHEILLVGKRGEPPNPLHSVTSIFKEARRKHSQKPDCVRQWIDSEFPNLSKIELFARQRFPGWDAWGNEV